MKSPRSHRYRHCRVILSRCVPTFYDLPSFRVAPPSPTNITPSELYQPLRIMDPHTPLVPFLSLMLYLRTFRLHRTGSVRTRISLPFDS